MYACGGAGGLFFCVWLCDDAVLSSCAGLAVFVGTTCGLFTVVVTSFVWLLSTVAWFVIVLVYTPVLNPFTVTSKLKVVCPLAGTFTVIPLLKSNCVDDGCPAYRDSVQQRDNY